MGMGFNCSNLASSGEPPMLHKNTLINHCVVSWGYTFPLDAFGASISAPTTVRRNWPFTNFEVEPSLHPQPSPNLRFNAVVQKKLWLATAKKSSRQQLSIPLGPKRFWNLFWSRWRGYWNCTISWFILLCCFK